MRGVIYRLGIGLKDLGERLRAPALIRLGLCVREAAL